MSCDHKCHSEETRLNPWVKTCPICGCPNFHYDPNAKAFRVTLDPPPRDSRLDIYHNLEVFPPEYLARNQVEPERTAKTIMKAHERRQARNARRLRHAESAGMRRPVFKVDLRKAATDGEV